MISYIHRYIHISEKYNNILNMWLCLGDIPRDRNEEEEIAAVKSVQGQGVRKSHLLSSGEP